MAVEINKLLPDTGSSTRPAPKRSKPSDHEFWFVGKIRRDNSLQKLNKRQQKVLKKVQRWEKIYGPLDQKQWDF
jgi:hypothetical protein